MNPTPLKERVALFARQFLMPAMAVALVPLTLAILMQMELGTTKAMLPMLRWLVLLIGYWWPLGLFFYLWPRGEIKRVLVGFALSVPLYVMCLAVVYPAAGARFAPKGASGWAIYLSSSPWFFLYVYLLYRLVRGRGWLRRVAHILALVLFIFSVAAPLAFRASVDPYKWPSTASASSLIIIKNVRVVEVERGRVVDDVNVHVQNGRIVALVNVKEDAASGDVVDAEGGYLMPGLSDVHTHLQVPVEHLFAPFSFRYFLAQLFGHYADHRRAYLSSGVTTVRDVGGPAATAFALRQELADRRLLGPRLLVVGRLITSPNGHPVGTIWNSAISQAGAIQASDAGAMRRELEADFTAGPQDAVKLIYGTIGRAPTRLRKDLLQNGVQWAADHHMISVVHAETAEEVRTAIKVGATGVEHVASIESLPNDLLALIASKRPFIDPTFGEYRAVLRLQKMPSATIDSRLAEKRAFVKALSEAGGRLVVGTDAPLVPYGSGVHDELDELKLAGFSPPDILRIATINNADYLGLGNETGRILPGFRADFVLTRANPLVDLQTLRTPVWVMLGGTIVARQHK